MRSHLGLEQLHKLLADRNRAVFVEGAVIAKACEIKFQRLRLDQPFARHIVDDEMGKIRLAGDRAERREFRCCEARSIVSIRMRIGTRSSVALSGEAGIGEGLPRCVGFFMRAQSNRLRKSVHPPLPGLPGIL